MADGRDPRVSVIMAAYNRERFLAEAVESILTQDFADFELILVDDGSTDATPEIAAGLARRDRRVVILRQNNAGVAAARNAAMARARGEYAAIMDSDDISFPMRLRRQVDFLDATPGVCGVGTRYFFIDADGRRTGPRRYARDPDAEPAKLPTEPAALRRRLLEKGVFHLLHPTAMFRTDAIREAGGYREIFQAAEDSDLHLRLLTGGQELANLDELLFLYRQGGDNLSYASLDVLIQRLAALAAAHRRLAGREDPLSARNRPIDYPCLMELMRGTGGVVWLEWIGVLQYHKCGEAGMLADAWQWVSDMDVEPDMQSELVRHWRDYCSLFSDEAEHLREKMCGKI